MLGAILSLSGCTGPAEQQKQAPAKQSQVRDERLLPIPQTNLRYLEEGSGKPCLVIGSAIYYPRTFSKRLPDHLKLYFVDMPWFSDAPYEQGLEEFDLDFVTARIEAVREGLQLEDFILIGHSIHGAVAWEYARRYPEHVSHLVVIGSPNIFANQVFYDAAAELWETADLERKRAWDAAVAAARPEIERATPDRQMVLNYVSNGAMYWYDHHYDASWLWEGMPIQMDLTNKLFGEIFHDYRMFESREKIPFPMLVVLGRYDYVIPYTTWDREKGRRNLTISIFDKSGHTPQLEESGKFDELLLTWIENPDAGDF